MGHRDLVGRGLPARRWKPRDVARRQTAGRRRGQARQQCAEGERRLVGTQLGGTQDAGQEEADSERQAHAGDSHRDRGNDRAGHGPRAFGADQDCLSS